VNLDINRDHRLSKSDLVGHWNKLGSLLSVEEVALWVEHALQLPSQVADIFRARGVTGFDFPDLLQKPGFWRKDPLEINFGIKQQYWRNNLRRGIQIRLLGLGSEPPVPSNFTCQAIGSTSLVFTWEQNNQTQFPVHKFVLKRQVTHVKAGKKLEPPSTIYTGFNRKFTDNNLEPRTTYTYILQSWNVVGHSPTVTIEATSRGENTLFSRVLLAVIWIGKGTSAVVGIIGTMRYGWALALTKLYPERNATQNAVLRFQAPQFLRSQSRTRTFSMDDSHVCSICKRDFQLLRRQQHHCSICSHPFCQDHGEVRHSPFQFDCGIPGRCVCCNCLRVVSNRT